MDTTYSMKNFKGKIELSADIKFKDAFDGKDLSLVAGATYRIGQPTDPSSNFQDLYNVTWVGDQYFKKRTRGKYVSASILKSAFDKGYIKILSQIGKYDGVKFRHRDKQAVHIIKHISGTTYEIRLHPNTTGNKGDWKEGLIKEYLDLGIWIKL
jgi:hypothetical protein